MARWCLESIPHVPLFSWTCITCHIYKRVHVSAVCLKTMSSIELALFLAKPHFCKLSIAGGLAKSKRQFYPTKRQLVPSQRQLFPPVGRAFCETAVFQANGVLLFSPVFFLLFSRDKGRNICLFAKRQEKVPSGSRRYKIYIYIYYCGHSYIHIYRYIPASGLGRLVFAGFILQGVFWIIRGLLAQG